jgi:hypothetical protein
VKNRFFTLLLSISCLVASMAQASLWDSTLSFLTDHKEFFAGFTVSTLFLGAIYYKCTRKIQSSRTTIKTLHRDLIKSQRDNDIMSALLGNHNTLLYAKKDSDILPPHRHFYANKFNKDVHVGTPTPGEETEPQTEREAIHQIANCIAEDLEKAKAFPSSEFTKAGK